MEPSYHTLQEIQTQPDAWAQAIQIAARQAEALRRLWGDAEFDQVIFTGCGSTYYLSLAGAALFQQLIGSPARAVPGGELLLYPAAAYPRQGKTLLAAISRSGTTTETIQALRAFQETGRGRSLVVTNHPDSPLGALGDLVLGIPAGQEQSVAQTRSFASMYVAVVAISTILSERLDLLAQMERLPQVGQRLLADYNDLARSLGGDLALERFYFLGSGPRYGLACEVNLKMKEMSLTHSEPFHFMEFRHGPMSMVNETAAVIGLLSDSQRLHEAAVMQEMGKLGGRLFSLGEHNADVAFDSRLPEEIRDVLYLPALQLMAYHRSIAKGLNPDRPKNLTAVVELDM
ncbi:MAG: SIS domain-containing protein [Anaerolineales bacterium]|nr:SIS domain-containing protein [Anaerolineales bacterium]